MIRQVEWLIMVISQYYGNVLSVQPKSIIYPIILFGPAVA